MQQALVLNKQQIGRLYGYSCLFDTKRFLEYALHVSNKSVYMIRLDIEQYLDFVSNLSAENLQCQVGLNDEEDCSDGEISKYSTSTKKVFHRKTTVKEDHGNKHALITKVFLDLFEVTFYQREKCALNTFLFPPRFVTAVNFY